MTLSGIECGLPLPFGERSCQSKFSVRSWSWGGQEGSGVIPCPGGMGHTPMRLGFPARCGLGPQAGTLVGGSTDTCSPKEVTPPSGLACGFQNGLAGRSAGPALRKPPLNSKGLSCCPITHH